MAVAVRLNILARFGECFPTRRRAEVRASQRWVIIQAGKTEDAIPYDKEASLMRMKNFYRLLRAEPEPVIESKGKKPHEI